MNIHFLNLFLHKMYIFMNIQCRYSFSHQRQLAINYYSYDINLLFKVFKANFAQKQSPTAKSQSGKYYKISRFLFQIKILFTDSSILSAVISPLCTALSNAVYSLSISPQQRKSLPALKATTESGS